MSPAPAHEPFLRAICEAPDDDAPRLVFADYLDETGDPDRATFIRRHIELARYLSADDLERWKDELFRQHAPGWIAELPGPASLWVEQYMTPAVRWAEEGDVSQLGTWTEEPPALKDWHRGFPAAVYVRGAGDVFLAHVDRITDLVPVRRISPLDADNVGELIRTIAGLPFLRKLRELKLPGQPLPDDAVVALANSPFATNLRFVALLAEGMTDRAGRAFAESPYLGDLEILHLLRTEFSDAVRAQLRARFGFRVHC
jgi:uncharacterized protein (TIGR02996 family)